MLKTRRSSSNIFNAPMVRTVANHSRQEGAQFDLVEHVNPVTQGSAVATVQDLLSVPDSYFAVQSLFKHSTALSTF